MTPEMLAKKMDEALGNIKEFQTTYDEALKKGQAEQGEVKEKLDKLSDNVADVMQLKQDYDAKMAELKHAIESINVEDIKDAPKDQFAIKALTDFMRDRALAKNASFDTYLGAQEFGEIDKKTMNTIVGPDGGYVNLPTFGGVINTRVFETSPVRPYADVEVIGNGSYVFVGDDQEAGANWEDELEAISQSDTPQFYKREIFAHKITAKPQISDEALEDSFVDLESWLSQKLSEKFSRTENTAFILGNGIKRPRGILTYSAWTTAGTYQRNAIEQINSGSSANLTADGLIDLQNSLLEYYQPNARFMMNRLTFKQAMKLKDGNNNYLFNRALDRNTGSAFDLLDRPVSFASDVPVPGANSLSVIYGDFREGYKIIDRRGIRILRDPYTTAGIVKFITTRRVGGDVKNFEALKIQKLAS